VLCKKVNSSVSIINKAPLCEGVWASGDITPPFLTSALNGGVWSASRSSRFTLEETSAGTLCAGGWVDLRQYRCCGEEKNILLLSGIEPQFLGRSTRSLVAILTELYYVLDL
jgi:hypothetical protein